MLEMTTKEKIVWLLTKFPEARSSYGSLMAYYLRYILKIKLTDRDFEKIRNLSVSTILRERTNLKNIEKIYPDYKEEDKRQGKLKELIE